MIKGCSLYTEDGWLDVPSIAHMGCWLNIIIGGRQVGKTYGVSKYLIDQQLPFIFMRLTAEELKAITSDPTLDPWCKYDTPERKIRMMKVKGSKTYTIASGDIDEEGAFHPQYRLGTGIALSTVASVRGFAGDSYKDLMFDEFIPESFVSVRKSSGDAFVNALITINGNRELQGKPPLRVWLLANSNNIASPILESLDILDELDQLRQGADEFCVTNDGVFIAYLKDSPIADRRKETAVIKRINKNSAVYKMAVDNEFSYSDLSDIKPQPIRGLKPHLNIGDLGIWRTGNDHFYVTTTKCPKSVPSYIGDKDIKNGLLRHPEIRWWWAESHWMTYYSTKCKLLLEKYLAI